MLRALFLSLSISHFSDKPRVTLFYFCMSLYLTGAPCPMYSSVQLCEMDLVTCELCNGH